MICLKENVRNYVVGLSMSMIVQGGLVALLGLVLPIQLVVSLTTILSVMCIANEGKKGLEAGALETGFVTEPFRAGALETGFVTAPLLILALAYYCNLYSGLLSLAYCNLYSGLLSLALGIVLLLIFTICDSLEITGFEEEKK